MDDLNFDSQLFNNDEEDLTTAAEVIQKLQEVWLNEKFAPELLMYEGELVECLLDQIQHMESSLLRIQKEDFRISFHKMELDRMRYLLSSYFRVRLEKIEKFGAHMLYQESEDLEDTHMSAEERLFAFRYVSSLKSYFRETALKKMPPNMQLLKLEEIACKPQLNQFVFVKVKKTCRGVLIEDFSDHADEEEIDLNIGSQLVVPYTPITTLLKSGSLKLI